LTLSFADIKRVIVRVASTAVLATFMFVQMPAVAQQLRPLPAASIYGELQQLRTLASVLYVAAHPDDENTRLLSWLARGRHIRTAYLSLTRGDGGQNILGSEQGAALGLIRTHELLAARRLDGAGQYFTRAIDFGYSKHADETLKHWDGRVLVDDIVDVYKRFRPDVVICRFPPSRMAGHGHHEASAILAHKAYDLCPPALRPRRLLFNAFRFGDRSTVADSMFRLEVGQYDPFIGMGYGELAGMSRSLHRSQGAGTPSTPGVQTEHFATVAGEPPTASLFDGIDTTWSRLGRADIGKAIDAVIARFWKGAPHEVLADLLKIREMIRTVDDPFWRELKLAEVNELITSCMGVTVDVSTARPYVVPGDSVDLTLRLVVRAGAARISGSVRWPDDGTTSIDALTHDVLNVQTHAMAVPASTPITQPYWLLKEGDHAMFVVPPASDPASMHGAPTSTPPLTVALTLMVDGKKVDLTVPVSTKKLDPTHGDVIEELRVVPAASIEPLSRTHVVSSTQPLSVKIRAFTNINNAALLMIDGADTVVVKESITLPAITDELFHVNISTLKGRTNRTVDFALRSSALGLSSSVRLITYDHIPPLQYLEPARVRIVAEPIAVTAKRIAFIAGAGDASADLLRSLGVTVDEVTEEQILETETLLKYDAVLLGIRAINTRKSMQYVMPALMSYVEGGGTVVVQYNTTSDMSTRDLGPFPLKLSRNRVTEEDAEVTVLKPGHPVLNQPNVIGAEDFHGWVQERGLYFPGEYDERYEEILSMHDEGEEALKGSLLYAQHGKGRYIYCALSLFRQIPAGVTGGLKLLANMVSQ
jgi:LmbE family N-acetylglucosaminyl deacetylase